MAKKRLNIKDKTGLPVDYDISAENVTIDGAGGKPLTQKLDEITETEAQAVRSITFNGQSYSRNNGIINIGEQEQPNWNESNPNYRTYIRNKPTLLSQFTNDCGFVTSSQIPEGADLSTVFASVAYDPTTSRINFFGKGSNTVLAYLDAAPFIVDGMVENVTLDSSTNELVITFNTASGKSPIRVPLGSISGQGTVQSVKMNGGTPIQPVNGVIDLGTVITEHQSLSSYATRSDLLGKVDKVTGYGLSKNDYTDAEKTKLAGIEQGAEVNVQSNWNQTDTSSDDYIKNKPTIPSRTSQLQNDSDYITELQLPRIVNGTWWVNGVDTGLPAQGPKGSSVADGDTFDIVNNLFDGGEGDALSAEMGKVLRKNVAIIAAKVDSLINALAGIAFVGDRVAPIGQLDWGGTSQTTYSITANFTGCSATEELPATVNELATLLFTLEAEQGYSLPYGIKVTVDGSPVVASYNRATGVVSIDAILGDVVINAVALDEDNTAFEGVGIYPNGSTDAFLMVGAPETRYISPVFDLGASRSSAVAVKYKGGGVAMYDTNGIYNGALSSQSSETTGEIPTTSRYIRLFGMTANIADGVLKVNDVPVFDGSKVGSDIGDADDFLADNTWCPQPNSNGDYVGWVFRFPGDAGYTPKMTSTNLDERKSLNACMCTKIGGGVAGAQGDYVIGKMIDMPMVDGLENKIKYSANEVFSENTAYSYLRIYTYANGAFSSANFSSFDNTVTWTQNGGVGSPDYVRVATFGSTGDTARNKAQLFCKKSTYESASLHAFIANGNNKVLWINPAYTGDVHTIIGAEVTP